MWVPLVDAYATIFLSVELWAIIQHGLCVCLWALNKCENHHFYECVSVAVGHGSMNINFSVYVCARACAWQSVSAAVKWKFYAPSDALLCRCGAGCCSWPEPPHVWVWVYVLSSHWTGTENTHIHTQHICNQLAHTQLKHIIASLSISSCSPSFNLVPYYKLVLNFIFSFF